MPLTDVTLVIGGARSGKSRYGETQIGARPGARVYVATAEARDDPEMRTRIADHRDRRGPGWETIEEPLDLAAAIGRADAIAGRDGGVLVDCLTLWLANAMEASRDVAADTAGLIAALDKAVAPVTLISNEIGLGLVPETPLGRAFRDAQGRLNQDIAAVAGHVVFVAAGLPLTLK